MDGVQLWTGHEARLLRAALRLSLRDFAAHLGVGLRTVTKWESRGQTITPQPHMQAVLDAAVHRASDGARRRLATSLRTDNIPAPKTAVRHEGVRSRARASTAAGWPMSNLDDSTIDDLRLELAVCKQANGSCGSDPILPIVHRILAVIEYRAGFVPADVRRELLAIGADAAELIGWLYRDLGNPLEALFWYDRSMEWAQENGDVEMQGYVLLKKSQMAYEERDAARVLGLAQAAQHSQWKLPPRVRAEVIQQEARGLAMRGESFDTVARKLDHAHQLADSAAFGDERSDRLGGYYDAGTHMLRSASCYIEAGKPAKAAMLFGEVIRAGHLSRRDEGYFRARYAAALALSGDPDAAAQEGMAAMGLVTELRSLRTWRELVRVVDVLGPWNSRPGPRALREALVSSHVSLRR